MPQNNETCKKFTAAHILAYDEWKRAEPWLLLWNIVLALIRKKKLSKKLQKKKNYKKNNLFITFSEMEKKCASQNQHQSIALVRNWIFFKFFCKCLN